MVPNAFVHFQKFLRLNEKGPYSYLRIPAESDLYPPTCGCEPNCLDLPIPASQTVDFLVFQLPYSCPSPSVEGA